MKMHEPIGPEMYGPFIVRIALGAYITLLSYNKMQHIPEFVQQIRELQRFSENFCQAAGILLPYLGFGAGLLLLIGMWTTFAALITTALLAGIIYMLNLYPHSITTVWNKEIILLAAAISLLYSGSGALSVDRFRKLG